MKNLIVKIITFVMNFFGVSIEDLVAFKQKQIARKILPEQPSYSKQLPLEVLYLDGTRSFFIEKGKTPIAIIVGDFGVAFEDAPETMDWYKAEEYCEQYSVGDKKWQLPNKDAGHLVTLYMNKDALNKVLKTFGKKPLKNHCYWASESLSLGAWIISLSDGTVDWDGESYGGNYVRPITIL